MVKDKNGFWMLLANFWLNFLLEINYWLIYRCCLYDYSRPSWLHSSSHKPGNWQPGHNTHECKGIPLQSLLIFSCPYWLFSSYKLRLIDWLYPKSCCFRLRVWMDSYLTWTWWTWSTGWPFGRVSIPCSRYRYRVTFRTNNTLIHSPCQILP